MTYQADISLLARIGWMYYIQNQTQQEIGQKLGFARTKVTRLLSRARELGIVEVNIRGGYRSCLDAEVELKSRFSLPEVIVVPSGSTEEESRAGVGMACADYLGKVLEDGDVLGCAWGRVLYQVGRFLKHPRARNLTVIQLMGGLNVGGKINPQEVIELIASQLNARGIWLNTPAVVGSRAIRSALLSDVGVRGVLDEAKRCTKALVGIGDMTPNASLVASGALGLTELAQLKESGAEGDILSRFFDASGNTIEHEINDRVISIELAELKRITLCIGATVGVQKAAATLGAIRGGYLDVLVTDEVTALAILSLGG